MTTREDEGFFEITSIHRMDIWKHFGNAAFDIPDDQMKQIAELMESDYIWKLFWAHMDEMVTNVTGLKPTKDDIRG